jgi:hypothetical protein
VGSTERPVVDAGNEPGCIAFPPFFKDLVGLCGGGIGLILPPQSGETRIAIAPAPCCLRHLELLERRIQDLAHGIQIVQE